MAKTKAEIPTIEQLKKWVEEIKGIKGLWQAIYGYDEPLPDEETMIDNIAGMAFDDLQADPAEITNAKQLEQYIDDCYS